MNQHQVETLMVCKAALKAVIAQIEAAIGVEAALPVTMPTLQALEATERLWRE
jgi:hypothetical protein